MLHIFFKQNWNAYLGKMNLKKFCFKRKRSINSSFHDVFNTSNYDGSISKYIGDEQYGTVNVELQFSVSTLFIERHNSSLIYSNFTGRDVGTQIRCMWFFKLKFINYMHFFTQLMVKELILMYIYMYGLIQLQIILKVELFLHNRN